MDIARELLGVGVEPKDLHVIHVCTRAFLFFILTLVIVRLAHRRFLSGMTPFDTVLGFLLASVLARAINGSGPLLATIAGAVLLVLLHRGVSALTFYSERFGRLLEGEPEVLVRDGKPDIRKLRAHKITEKDLLEEGRLNGQLSDLKEIKTAVLERNGKISVIPLD
jgi:uncharacterized membrane protein YcaP (DUF421 family)